MSACWNCGQDNPDVARFCLACGTVLVPEAPPEESRRTVTVVFCDLVGSTALGERLDSESLREVMSRYFAAMRAPLERHGGAIEKYIGDAVMAVFGLPRAHEDDALRAVRATVEMAQALGPLNEELVARWGVTVSNRIGVHTGEVTAGDATTGQRLVTGDAVNVAARLEQAAGSGEVLIGESTYRLVRGSVASEPVEPVVAKGKSEPLSAYRVLSILSSAEAIPRRSDIPIVGREAELRTLSDVLEQAQLGACRLVTVEGDAGVGKTRLVAEHVASAGPGVAVLRGRCLPYGQSSALGPAAEIVRTAADVEADAGFESARAKLRELLGGAEDAEVIASRLLTVIGMADDAHPLEELFWAVRRSLEERARDVTALVVVEDIHWAQSTTLSLLGHLAANARASLLIVCTARPDLRDAHPEWPGEVPDAVWLRLGPLGEDQAEQLVERLLGPEVLADVKLRIATTAEGNPLFVEQLVSMLADDGLLVRRDARWQATGSLDHLAVPPSIAGLLATRLDRLPSSERAVVERAAVVGPSFSSDAVAELCPDTLRPTLTKALDELVGRDFLLPEESGYRFGHALIREAAYMGILKRTRAELHARVARWLERTAGDALFEREELIATHLEQAYRTLVSLGPVGEEATGLASEAASRFHAAGMRALARADPSSAVDLLSRASDLAPDDLEILMELADANDEAGNLERAQALVADVIELARVAADPRMQARAEVSAVYLESVLNPAADSASIIGRAEQATKVLEDVGTDRDRSLAWFQLSMALSTAGRITEADQAGATAAMFAARAGEEWREGVERAFRVANAMWGSTPVADAIALAEETMEWAQGMPSVEGRLVRMLGFLKVMAGRVDEGRADFKASESTFERLGMKGSLAATMGQLGEAMIMAGRPEEAEWALRRGLAVLGPKTAFALQVRLALALATLELGRGEEAASLMVGTERMAEGWDAQSRIWVRSTGARVRAALGEVEEAKRAAREGVEIAEGTELVNDQGAAWIALGEVLERSGRAFEAAEAYREALARYERKGNLAGAERVRERLAQTAAH